MQFADDFSKLAGEGCKGCLRWSEKFESQIRLYLRMKSIAALLIISYSKIASRSH